jgi:predicted adenine nucleotide alpha hydrolase (AANH) superfamily ATPase
MFQKYLSQVNIVKSKKPKLLLHICCGPDLIIPLLDLKKYFKLYLYWYNPNIQPYSEYKKRYKEYIKILQLEDGDFEIISDETVF